MNMDYKERILKLRQRHEELLALKNKPQPWGNGMKRGGVYVKSHNLMYISAKFVLKNVILHTHLGLITLIFNEFTCVCKM